MTFCLQNCFQSYEMAFFIGYQVEGCFSSVKVQKSSIQEQGRVCWGHCEPFGRIQTPQVIMDLSFMYKAYCDEAKAVFLCLVQKKKPQIRLNLRLLAEMVDILPRAKQQPAGLIACGLRAAALFSSSPSLPQKRHQPELVPFVGGDGGHSPAG